MKGKQLTLGDILYEVIGSAFANAATSPRNTRKAAQEAIAHDTPRLREFVYDAVYAAGEHGATCDELEQCLHLRHQTCSARVNELRNGKRIRDSGKRRLTRSGRAATVWVAV